MVRTSRLSLITMDAGSHHHTKRIANAIDRKDSIHIIPWPAAPSNSKKPVFHVDRSSCLSQKITSTKEVIAAIGNPTRAAKCSLSTHCQWSNPANTPDSESDKNANRSRANNNYPESNRVWIFFWIRALVNLPCSPLRNLLSYTFWAGCLEGEDLE
jgi:hypothetical protein